MMPRTNDKTQLEWFFNPQMAGNAPQTSVSMSLLNVLVAFSKLADSIFHVMRSVPESISAPWISISRQASTLEEKLKRNFSLNDAFDLISFLNEVGSNFLTLNNLSDEAGAYQKVAADFRRVLANLILFAKESDDANFKSDVLNLVKRWEAIK